MPIYEYQAKNPEKGCRLCRTPFERLQNLKEPALEECPQCGRPLRKLISWCRAAVVEVPVETTSVESRIRGYERDGMWSHAAELADKHSDKTKDKSLKTRALENYEKAGYDAGVLSRHAGDD